MIAAIGAFMHVRSHRVPETVGWAHVVTEGADRRFHDVRLWSAKGGVGIYICDYWNLTNNNTGWAFYHQVGQVSHEYPYAVTSTSGGKTTRWKRGQFAYMRSEVGRDKLWMQMDNAPPTFFATKAIESAWVLPYWSLVVVGLPLPILATVVFIRTRRRKHRSRAGLCRKCGYDLRASPDRCPECGTARV
jgi:hypothetical protein